MAETKPETPKPQQPKRPLEAIRDRELMQSALRRAAEFAARRREMWANGKSADRP